MMRLGVIPIATILASTLRVTQQEEMYTLRPRFTYRVLDV